jgi:tRNA threonylcarbamoyladenosine biosynthesis protein TsaE
MPEAAVPRVPPLAGRGHLALTELELVHWGEELGHAVRPPLVVAISGDLGAGKTTLVQAICRGYGVTEPVTSPTFALVHEYVAPASAVYHLDLYRITDERDLRNLAWDEVVSAHALVLVEWAAHAGRRLPANHVPIALDYAPGDPTRRILLAG